MLTMLKRILYDETAFQRYARAVIGAGSILLLNGKVPETKQDWIAAFGMFFAYLIGSGTGTAPPAR